MHLSGETEIAASRQRVWETISNPNRGRARPTPPARRRVEKIDDRHYQVTVVARRASRCPMNVVLDLAN